MDTITTDKRLFRSGAFGGIRNLSKSNNCLVKFKRVDRSSCNHKIRQAVPAANDHD